MDDESLILEVQNHNISDNNTYILQRLSQEGEGTGWKFGMNYLTGLTRPLGACEEWAQTVDATGTM